MKNYLSYRFLMPRVKRDTTIPKHMVLMEMGFMLHKLEEKAPAFYARLMEFKWGQLSNASQLRITLG